MSSQVPWFRFVDTKKDRISVVEWRIRLRFGSAHELRPTVFVEIPAVVWALYIKVWVIVPAWKVGAYWVSKPDPENSILYPNGQCFWDWTTGNPLLKFCIANILREKIISNRNESSRNERQSGERSFACSVGANPVLRVDTPLYELRALFLLQTIESPLDCYFYYRLRNQMDTISSLRIRIEVETRQEM